MQESGISEITPFICFSAVWGQYVCFSYPEFLSAHLREWLQPNGCQIAGTLPSWMPLGSEMHIERPESLMTVTYLFTEYSISQHQLNYTSKVGRKNKINNNKVGRKFVCKWLYNTMAQWYDKGFTFYWTRVLFEFEASDIFICFKVNSNAAFTHRDYLLVEKATSK